MICSLEVGYDFSSFSVLSATSSMDYTTNASIGFKLGSFLTPVGQQLNADIFSQELRAASSLDGPWQWSSGIFYRTVDQLIIQSLSAIFADNFHVIDESESLAVFGELTRSLLDNKLDITVGIRYFEDTVDTLKVSNFTGPENLSLDNDFDDLSGRVVLTYYPSDDLTLYTSIARGFRSGFNQPPSILVPNAEPVEPDSLLSYEIGVKGSLNSWLTYETAVYYSDWRDAAQTLNVNGFAQTVNSETVNGFGVDANIGIKPIDGLTLGLNFGWNDLTFDGDVVSAGSVIFEEGRRINLSAEYTAGFSAEYVFPVFSDLQSRFFVGGNYNSELLNLIGTTEPVSDEIFNARMSLGIEPLDANWGISLFVENLTDEDGRVDPFTPAVDASVRLRPRTAGVQFIFNY